MGVWKRSAVGRLMGRTDAALIAEYDRVLPGWAMRDVPGSPYCIQAYEPDERMGGWKGLDKCRADLEERGMSLVLDFVPNHTGFDHDWIRTNPEFYVQGTLDNYRAEPILYHPIEDEDGDTVHFIACGRDPFFPPWRDVAQLNYFNPATREAMIGVLTTIAQHADGVRCDMAMLVLNDVFAQTWQQRVDLLWAHARARVLARGDPPRADDLPRRGLLGSRVPAPAAGLRLHLRQAAARSAAPRRSAGRRAAISTPTRPTARSSRASSRTMTKRAASPSSAIASAPPRR